MQRVRLEWPGQQPVEVVVEHDKAGGAHDYVCRLPDRSFAVSLAAHDANRGFLITDHRVHRYRILRRNDHFEVWINGVTHRINLPQRTVRHGANVDHAAPVGDIVAAMPGTVLKIEVVAGDRFVAHQPLVIMESMKMEMTLSSPRAGRVTEVACRAGQLVDIGALLIRVETDPA